MLHYNTVTPLLLEVLNDLMNADEFGPFRLVGGTALSLYYGHRMSIDIDLFSHVDYNSLDFKILDEYLRERHPYVETNDYDIIGMGKSYFIGDSPANSIKLDLFYNDGLIDDPVVIDGIRLASVEPS